MSVILRPSPISAQHCAMPQPLAKGDTIAIVSPAGAVNPQFFPDASQMLRQQGWEIEIYPTAMGRSGTFSGTRHQRLSDLCNAFLAPDTKAIMCARGGYGAVHLLEELDRMPIEDNPKWLIGFSDISALHALMRSHGVASVHASMIKGLSQALHGQTEALKAANYLFEIMNGERPEYNWPSHPLNRQGEACGTLAGGNLAVLSALIGTKFNVFAPHTILFIEDIAEPIYKVERMLYQLRLAGILPHLKGLIVGEFTDTRPDANHASVEAMIAQMVEPYSYPVAFAAPIGHGAVNYPLIHNAAYSFSVK